MKVLFSTVILTLVFSTLAVANDPSKSLEWDSLRWAELEEQLEQQRVEVNLRDVLALTSDLKVYVDGKTSKNVSEMANLFRNDITTLSDRPSILDGARMGNNNFETPSRDNLPATLKSFNLSLENIPAKSKILETKLVDAITRILNFYDSQLDEIRKGDTALALMFLKGADEKHGKVFQKSFPLEKWIQIVCENTRNSNDGGYCQSLARQWKNRSGSNLTNKTYWKPASILQKRVSEIDDKALENIGNEKDGIWGPLNGQCQLALVNRCEVPYVCERTLLDPTPRSQYLLTHQLLQRILMETVDCQSTKSFKTDDDTFTSLCAKMYVEAKYLDILDVPIVQRDLFTEMVGLCGYMGYSNFLREDWLDRILAWQSKSDSGCFVKDPLSPVRVLSTDIGFQRRATKKEVEQGVQQTKEKCLPHLTSVGLMALSAHWDYMRTVQTD